MRRFAVLSEVQRAAGEVEAGVSRFFDNREMTPSCSLATPFTLKVAAPAGPAR